MITSLFKAQRKGVITADEFFKAGNELISYLKNYIDLSSALVWNGLHNSASIRMSIYSNWKHRPILH